MASPLPQTTATLYQLADGTFSADQASGGAAVTVPVTDLVWVDDMEANGAETTSDLQCLSQDLYHVLLQSLGSNLDAENLGIGIQGLLSGTSVDLAADANQIDRQYELDTRVTQSSTTLTIDTTQTPPVYSIASQVIASGAVLPMQASYSKLTGLQLLGAT